MAITPNTEGMEMDADRYRIHVYYKGGAIKTAYHYRDTMAAAISTAERLAGSDQVRRTVSDPAYRVRAAVVIVEARESQHDAYGRPYHNPRRGWQTVATVDAGQAVTA